MKKTTNANVFTFVLFALFITFYSCKKDETDELPGPLLLDCNSFQSSFAGKLNRLVDRGEGIDYIIDCVISVELDLVIDPGVTIAFTSGSGMIIQENGSLSASGTIDKPISFTGTDALVGFWKGIISYSANVKNRLNYVVVEYAGGGAFNSNGDLGSIILWADTYFRIENTTIRKGASFGLNCDYTNYNLELNNVTITECVIPINTADPNIIKNISSGSFTGNNVDVIKIGRTGGTVLSQNHIWENLGVPYRMSSLLWVNDASLTIKPGVVMEFENGTGIRISDSDQSTLIAKGTSTNPIVFTGVTKVAGAWANIDFRFTKSPLNEISYAIIEYAGNAGSEGAIYMWAKPSVKVNNVLFRHIGTCAIYDSSYDWDPNQYLLESNNSVENVTGGYMCIN